MSASTAEIIVDNFPLVRAQEAIYEDDVWELAAVGIKPPPYIATSTISFKRINPAWLRRLAKRYIRYQAATKAYYTLQQHLRSIGHFSNFLTQYNRIVQKFARYLLIVLSKTEKVIISFDIMNSK